MSTAQVNIDRFKTLLLATSGMQFADERERTLRDALKQRMNALGLAGLDAYYEPLNDDPREMQELIDLLTVNETYFLREPEYLKLLLDRLIPEMLAGRKEPLRIVCAGCSSGEEPYTLAMLLDQRFGAAGRRLFKIVAFDIDAGMIAAARRGIYRPDSFRGASEFLRQRYFKPHASGGWQLDEEIRGLVHFEVCNLLAASYPSALGGADVILYRNVSIYFPAPVQQEIFSRLAAQLADDGCLLVGASETMHHNLGILSLVEMDSRFFFRKPREKAAFARQPRSRRPAVTEVRELSGQRVPPVVGGERRRLTAASETAMRTPVREPARSPQDAVFDEALDLARQQRFDEARKLLARIVEQDRSFSRAYALEGCILTELEQFAEAQQYCLTALRYDSLCLEAYLLLGINARQRADHQEAGRRFREALYIDRACWPAHFYLAETTWALGDIGRADRSYRSALDSLRKTSEGGKAESFFPLTCNRDHFVSVCRHKLSHLTIGE